MLFAQDTTTRVWDIRQPGKSLVVLSGRMGAVRSLRFSSDGRFLAMAEPADFVHLFDVEGGFKRYTRLAGILRRVSGLLTASSVLLLHFKACHLSISVVYDGAISESFGLPQGILGEGYPADA